MNFFERIIVFLQHEMTRPKPFGWFHLLFIGLTIFSIVILFLLRKKYNDKQLKIVLFIYGFIAFVLELLKQIIWSFEFGGSPKWDYPWYIFPFQLCTTPIFVSLICLFLKKGKVRDSLLSYLSFITILGSFMTIIIPTSCFVETTLVNIHTMYLHCGSFVVSIYLLISGEIKLDKQNLINSFKVFIIFIIIALFLNITFYNFNLINNEEFNMFYISPYFVSSLPVYNVVYENTPYIIFLLFYIISICIGGSVIYIISNLIGKMYRKIIK